MTGHPESSHWGWFALVCYVRDPLKSAIDRLKQLIPSKELPEAHITVLPPRPLGVPIEEACGLIGSALNQFVSFEAELSEVCRFAETSFLYLDIAGGSQHICKIHANLNATPLAFHEIFEFRPHLTLGGPVPAAAIESVRLRVEDTWRAMDIPRGVSIRELVCLWLAPDGERIQWSRFRSFSLSDPASHFALDSPSITSQTC